MLRGGAFTTDAFMPVWFVEFLLNLVERVGSKCEQQSGTTACAVKERILVLDGGMGTMIQSYRLKKPIFVVNALPTGHAISKATRPAGAQQTGSDRRYPQRLL